MATGLHPLDAKIAIAELFDSGRFNGQATSDEIAEAVGIKWQTVGRRTQGLDFTLVKKRSPQRVKIPHRFAPPRNGLKLPKRAGPVTKDIVALYEEGRWTGPCYARDLAGLLNVTEDAVGRSLKALRFKMVKRAHRKFEKWLPAVYAPPPEWPALFQKQRELRRSGLSADAVMRATDSAAGVTAIIERAVRALDMSDVPLDARGALKKKIKGVIADIHREWSRDSIPRSELARWLKEDGERPVAYLQSRVEGYVRFASRRTCPHCGRKP